MYINLNFRAGLIIVYKEVFELKKEKLAMKNELYKIAMKLD